MRRGIFYIFILLFSTAFIQVDLGNLHYYKGTIGAATKIQMNFEIEGTLVKGSYILEDSGEVFVFNGNINEQKQRLVLIVQDQEKKQVATIKAAYYIDPQQQLQDIEGLWISTDGKVMRLKIKKVAEVIA